MRTLMKQNMGTYLFYIFIGFIFGGPFGVIAALIIIYFDAKNQ